MSTAHPTPLDGFWRALAGDPRFAMCSTTAYEVAGQLLRIHLADDRLAPLVAPLEHRRRNLQRIACAPRPSLNLFAWTTRDAGEWRTLSQLFNDAHLRLAEAGPPSDLRAHYDPEHRLLCVFDPGASCAAFVLPDAALLPFWEWAAPFRLIFHWWSEMQAGQLTHAAAVGINGQGVLLVGPGGSGKSTTAVACLDAGLQYISDDYTLVTMTAGPVAHALYGSAKMRSDFLPRALPGWSGRVARQIGPERKSMFLVDRWAPAQLVDRLRLRAICVPRITAASRARLELGSAKQALLALAPSSMNQLPTDRRQSFDFLRRLVESLPTYTLRLGKDIASGPQALAGLLSDSTFRRIDRAA